MKGVIDLASTGYITVHAYTSIAQLPVKDVAISITAADGTAIAMALTDRNGQIRQIPIPVPDRDASLTPNPGEKPFTSVNLYARARGYEQAEYENLQVFAGTVTLTPWSPDKVTALLRTPFSTRPVMSCVTFTGRLMSGKCAPLS